MKKRRNLVQWWAPRKRLWIIWSKLGYNPWRKPQKKAPKQRKGVYIGTKEAIPFMNDDAKRTFSHLLLRPGYMMRDYIFRGQHERYLAPFTALLVFYSVFTLIVAVVQPGVSNRESILEEISQGVEVGSKFQSDTTHTVPERGQVFIQSILKTMYEAYMFTRLDLHPESVDTPWKASIAAVEGDLRSKGIPLFLGNFLMLWMAMAFLLRKRGVSVSGAAAASAYVLCQFCIFKFLALIITSDHEADIDSLVMGALLLIDYRQFLGLKTRPAFWLTVKTGLVYLLVMGVFYSLVAGSLVLFTMYRI